MTMRTEFERTFFAGFWFFFYFWGQGENTPGTTHLPPRNLVNKVQVKSGEIPVLKNLRKIIRKVDSRSLTPKSTKWTCHPILKIINTEKDLKISKNKFNRYGGQVGSCLDSGTIWYGRAWMCNFTFPTFGKFEVFREVWCRTCDMSPCKWVYWRL